MSYSRRSDSHGFDTTEACTLWKYRRHHTACLDPEPPSSPPECRLERPSGDGVESSSSTIPWCGLSGPHMSGSFSSLDQDVKDEGRLRFRLPISLTKFNVFIFGTNLWFVLLKEYDLVHGS